MDGINNHFDTQIQACTNEDLQGSVGGIQALGSKALH
jgi:hypothetical protein